ncbi:hypothetical protein TMatcc_005289 [Talaromyces marneffei ATCC 18224]
MDQKTQKDRLAADNHLVDSDSVAFGADDEIRKVAARPVAIAKKKKSKGRTSFWGFAVTSGVLFGRRDAFIFFISFFPFSALLIGSCMVSCGMRKGME